MNLGCVEYQPTLFSLYIILRWDIALKVVEAVLMIYLYKEDEYKPRNPLLILKAAFK